MSIVKSLSVGDGDMGTLPSVVPELSYDGMKISNGDMAMLAYKKMAESKSQNEIEHLKEALLEYCRLDSLGMVRIYEKLKKVAI